MASWAALGAWGVERELYDDTSAGAWIAGPLGGRHASAFRRARHPAMRSDYFRRRHVFVLGGCYVDGDDRLVDGRRLPRLRPESLYLAPLCYDKVAGGVTDPARACRGDRDPSEFVLYVNNNPLIAPPRHRVVGGALERATAALLDTAEDDRDVQALTGPGNLTAALVECLVDDDGGTDIDVGLLLDWDEVCVSRWPLGYRDDERNWRVWARRGGVPT